MCEPQLRPLKPLFLYSLSGSFLLFSVSLYKNTEIQKGKNVVSQQATCELQYPFIINPIMAQQDFDYNKASLKPSVWSAWFLPSISPIAFAPFTPHALWSVYYQRTQYQSLNVQALHFSPTLPQQPLSHNSQACCILQKNRPAFLTKVQVSKRIVLKKNLFQIYCGCITDKTFRYTQLILFNTKRKHHKSSILMQSFYDFICSSLREPIAPYVEKRMNSTYIETGKRFIVCQHIRYSCCTSVEHVHISYWLY
eukprot:TRINITY_DN1049_c0_g1_i1.p2 TRINITY_DN1049_c0_g1~~TRINITY_DN1049_c0_g1_i1.p2  ORF type:complete len:278 (+),score=-44.01 TRINITY_DN1049_c0_g1_i1:79-834(+)